MQQFILMQLQHTGVPQEFLKHAIPDYLFRGTDLFFFFLVDFRVRKEGRERETSIFVPLIYAFIGFFLYVP